MVLLIKQVVIHQQTLLYRKISDLRDEIDDLAKPEEVLVAQDRLKDFDFLNFCVIVYYLWVSKQGS